MTNRSTKTLQVSEGNTVEIYDYITGGELRKIQALYLKGVKAGDVVAAQGKTNEEIGEAAMKDMDANVFFEAQELVMQIMVVSVNGCSREEAYQAVQDLRPEELAIVITELQEYTSGVASKKK